MFKRALILTFLLGAYITSTVAQKSAQATMRVSVEVVSGTSVEVIQPDIVTLSQESKSILGILTIQGLQEGNIHIINASSVILKNKDGDEVRTEVISRRERKVTGSEIISYEGLAKAQMENSTYQGELATTIEYF